MNPDTLWNELHDLFDTDDGSLAEISLCSLSPNGVADIFALLLRLSAALKGATFWSIRDQRDLPASSVSNATALVVEGRAEPFHLICKGLRTDGVVIPDLGVFVFADQLVLDYQMGDEWNGIRLAAFLSLLHSIREIDRGVQIRLPDFVLSGVQAQFERSLSRFADTDA